MKIQSIKIYSQASSRLFKKSYQLYDHHLPRFLGVVALPLLFLCVVNWLLNITIASPVIIKLVDQNNFGTIFYRGVPIIFGTVCAMALALLYIALLKMIEAIDQQKKMGIVESYRSALPLGSPYLLVLLMVFIFVLFLILAKVILWNIALVMPVIIFGLYLPMATITSVLEGKVGMESFRKSKMMVHAHWVYYTGNTALMLALVYLIFRSFDLILANTFGVNDVDGEFKLLAEIGEWLFYLLAAMLSIFPQIFMYYLYQDLKKKATLLTFS